MKILELAYEDKVTGWKLNPVQFSDLNLLVGVSGVGKTKILKAILKIKAIAKGFRYRGIKWSIRFLTIDQVEYQWEGEFDFGNTENQRQNVDKSENKFSKIASEEDESDFPNPKIIYESLSHNKNESPLSIQRKQETITFNNENVIVKLSQKQSLISLFNGEEDVKILSKEFSLIKISQAALFEDDAFRSNTDEEYENGFSGFKGFNRNSVLFKKVTFEDYQQCSKDLMDSEILSLIQNERISMKGKLVLSAFLVPKYFREITTKFKEIFSSIEKVEAIYYSIDIDELVLDIRFKEKHSDWLISQAEVSSGMLKTLLHLSELYFSLPGSVILIDEFENSLGVNCLDAVTEDINDSPNQLQFIITSHHPYVINNIRPSHWKIVTRQGGNVTVKSAEDFHIAKSRQKAYIDLINVLKDDEQDSGI
jgi:ATPase subunit of ABC transporter with duplicated ATPase domains